MILLIKATFDSVVSWLSAKFLSDRFRLRAEKWIVAIAIGTFLTHLSLIALGRVGALEIGKNSELLQDPIAAIYTPFSFILVYEVYLLIFYLPKSITQYIGKQYEIITLIVIRRIFKDIANLEFTSSWFSNPKDQQFMFDVLTTLVLFFLIFCFYRLNADRIREPVDTGETDGPLQNFIKIKKALSALLVPVLVALASYSLASWTYRTFSGAASIVSAAPDLNQIFFEDFFTILIMIDVLLLIFSFVHTDNFPKVIRNSGFIISTVLLKLSFSTEGLLNVGLILGSVTFGVVILYIHNLYEKLPRQ